jgi:membrane protease YdiL (CAAX protease family)
MSSSSSNAPLDAVVPVIEKPAPQPLKRRILLGIGLPIWVFLGFMLAQAIVLVLIELFQKMGVPLGEINPSLFQLVAGGVVYALALVIVIGVPWWVKKARTTKEELGVQRWPTWMDIVWAPAGAIVYIILTSIIATIAMSFLKFVNYSQTQDTGFTNLSSQSEYIMAFIMLVIIAPIAEEILFRGYLLGKLRKYAPLWVAIIVTSLVFAVVHFAWNVGLDVFALSIALCLLRVVTGSLWASILLHMMKNSVAFYFLFINPIVLSTMGG